MDEAKTRKANGIQLAAMVAKSLQAQLAACTVERTVYRKPAVDPSGEFDFVHTIATGSSATVSKPNATFGEAQKHPVTVPLQFIHRIQLQLYNYTHK